VDTLTTLAHNKEFKVSASNFFIVDVNLFINILAVTITYVVALEQFKPTTKKKGIEV